MGSKPGYTVPVGALAKLGRFQRMQDGLEVWAIWLDKPMFEGDGRMWCASHNQLERLPPA